MAAFIFAILEAQIQFNALALCSQVIKARMDTVLANPPFSLLPKSIQERVVQEMKDALPIERARAVELRAQLEELESSIEKSIEFLRFFPQDGKQDEKQEDTKVTALKIAFKSVSASVKQAEGYQKSWTQPQKLLYVLAHPLDYGTSPTFVTYARVLEAIFQEEPELLEENAEDWRKRFGEALSRLVTQREIVPQMREKGTKGPLHYISPDWFVNGLPKPEYAEVLANLEPAPIERKPRKATAPADAGAEDSTSAGDTVEEDANPDTDEVNPPVYKAKEQSRLPEPTGLFLTS